MPGSDRVFHPSEMSLFRDLAFEKMFPFHANTTEDRESEEGEEGTKQKLC